MACVECGLLLAELRSKTREGEWGETISAIGFARSTAYFYMKCAEKWEARKKQLSDGIFLCHLLRESEFNLLPELQGGGQRLGKEELERRRAQSQLLFDFDRIAPAFDAILHFDGGNPLTTAPDETIEALEAGAKKVLLWAKEARAEKEAIET